MHLRYLPVSRPMAQAQAIFQPGAEQAKGGRFAAPDRNAFEEDGTAKKNHFIADAVTGAVSFAFGLLGKGVKKGSTGAPAADGMSMQYHA